MQTRSQYNEKDRQTNVHRCHSAQGSRHTSRTPSIRSQRQATNLLSMHLTFQYMLFTFEPEGTQILVSFNDQAIIGEL